MRHIKKTVEKFGAESIAQMQVGGIRFDIGNPRAVKFLATKRFKIQGINETTQRRLAKKLSAALEAGKSQGDMIKIVQGEFKFARRFRAARIARTEIASSANHGITEGQKQGIAEGSVLTHKRWINSRDGEVRDDHRVEQTQRAEDPFDIGGEFLDFPGDPGGSAGNIINCFPAGTLIGGSFVGGMRANYSGKMITIRTRKGLNVSVTPNHPILTDTGFIPACEINEVTRLVWNLGHVKKSFS